MTSPAYEYHDLMAETWDVFRGDTSRWEDRAFYLEAVQRFGQPVLDLGCGTGRIVLDFLAQGIDCDGVDNSPEMLAIARRKAEALGLEANLYQQGMESLDLPRRYRTILVPSSSFQLLVDPAAAGLALARFRDHLAPGGWLVMPFMVLWRPGDPVEKDWALSAEAVRSADGATLRRWSRSWFDPEAALEHTEDRYDVLLDGQVVLSESHRQSPATRSYSQPEARALYLAAGLTEIEILRGFTWEAALPEDWLFTVLGRRA